MKLNLLIVILIICSSIAYSQDSEDKEVLELLRQEKTDVIVKSTKGSNRGVLIHNKNGIAVVAVKKDLLLASKIKEVRVYSTNVKETMMVKKVASFTPDILMEGKFYGSIILRDEKGQLGLPSLVKNPIKINIQKYNGKMATGLKLNLNRAKENLLMFIGKVKLGTFAGSANASGKKGKTKYKVYEAAQFGALVIRESGVPKWSPQIPSFGVYSDSVAFAKIPKGKDSIDLLINDKDTKNNKGNIYIIYK